MRVIAGPEKKSRLISPKEREIIAVHEMGHALVGHYLEQTDEVHKVTIVGRGQAGGLTVSFPSEDRGLASRGELLDKLAMTLGGRTAEELVFGEITTGASNDLERVTDSAKRMVMRWGMSEKLGPRTFGNDYSQPFLGRDFGHEADYSDEIAREIDDEIRRIVEDSHERARKVLTEHDRRAAAAVEDPDRVRDDRSRRVPAPAGRRARRRRCSPTSRRTRHPPRRLRARSRPGRGRSACRSPARSRRAIRRTRRSPPSGRVPPFRLTVPYPFAGEAPSPSGRSPVHGIASHGGPGRAGGHGPLRTGAESGVGRCGDGSDHEAVGLGDDHVTPARRPCSAQDDLGLRVRRRSDDHARHLADRERPRLAGRAAAGRVPLVGRRLRRLPDQCAVRAGRVHRRDQRRHVHGQLGLLVLPRPRPVRS